MEKKNGFSVNILKELRNIVILNLEKNCYLVTNSLIENTEK